LIDQIKRNEAKRYLIGSLEIAGKDVLSESSDALYSAYGLHDAIAKDPYPNCNLNSYE